MNLFMTFCFLLSPFLFDSPSSIEWRRFGILCVVCITMLLLPYLRQIPRTTVPPFLPLPFLI